MTLENVLDILIKKFKPYSIFLYGSRATDASNNKSDYEIGIIFEDNKYVSRSELTKTINNPNFAIFPFRLSEIVNYDIDTPFQKNIYMSVLISGGSKHLYGENILEKLEKPKITTKDLLADVNFNLGVVMTSIRVYKSGNNDLASDLFAKSCLYATRDLIYYYSQNLCLSYKEIYENSGDLEILNDYMEIINYAYAIRIGKNVDEKAHLYYKNISYINKFILKKIVEK